ncbi:hypothetical protein [Vibrio owensii]|uniref:hypothetical protein n=1 Tax=Vibrio owensii TaxID=696485 RepID=UPI003CC50F5E
MAINKVSLIRITSAQGAKIYGSWSDSKRLDSVGDLTERFEFLCSRLGAQSETLGVTNDEKCLHWAVQDDAAGCIVGVVTLQKQVRAGCASIHFRFTRTSLISSMVKESLDLLVNSDAGMFFDELLFGAYQYPPKTALIMRDLGFKKVQGRNLMCRKNSATQ